MELFRAMILMLYLFLCAFIMVNMEHLMRKLSDRMLQFWLKDVKNIIEERGSEFLAVSYQWSNHCSLAVLLLDSKL